MKIAQIAPLMESVPPRHKEEDELGAENGPEHIAVSDGGKPEPIDQDITREAQCPKRGNMSRRTKPLR
jgi:hypothetical protein